MIYNNISRLLMNTIWNKYITMIYHDKEHIALFGSFE